MVDMVEPAAAHVCALPVELEVGEPSSVALGVGAEAVAVTEIEVETPEGFEVTDVSGTGWQVETDERRVRFTGGEVAPYSCANLTLRGVAAEHTKLVFPLTLHADGEVATYDNPEPFYEDSALVVYAGLEVPEPPGTEDDAGGTPRLVAVGLIGAGLVWLLITAGYWWRTRRPRV